MRILKSATGQSTAEYAIVIAIVLGAVVGMQTFVKRGLQARYKDVTDSMTTQDGTDDLTGINALPQYEPYYAHQDMKTDVKDEYNDEMKSGGEVVRSGAYVDRTRQSLGLQEERGATSAVDQTAIDNAWK